MPQSEDGNSKTRPSFVHVATSSAPPLLEMRSTQKASLIPNLIGYTAVLCAS